MKNYFIAYGTILNTRMDIKEMEEKVNHALNMDTAGLVRFGPNILLIKSVNIKTCLVLIQILGFEPAGIVF